MIDQLHSFRLGLVWFGLVWFGLVWFGLIVIDAIADLMNGRPRKTLDWCTPHEVYSAWLAKLEDSAQTIQ